METAVVDADAVRTSAPSKDDPANLEALFYPQSIAVLGVTQTPGTVPYDIFYNILASGYQGVIYPVAPGKRSICSVRAYRYITDIDDQVDMAVIVFPASVVDKAVEQCGRKGVKGVIIISAGFREVGPEGVKREQRIKDLCRQYNIHLIGPNCLGLINTDPASRLNASFARKMPAQGRIAFLSQSGALCTAVLDYARGKGIGFSKFVSFGNKAGVTEIELMQYLHRDPQTDVILLYLEELRNGRALIEAARAITRGAGAKPILVIKSGRTPQGAHAAASHTGSLAAEDNICEAVFREAGIIRVPSIEELFNTAIMLTGQPMPKGRRLAIVTNAGGPGVMATDAAVSVGLELARLNEGTTRRLRDSLPATANIKNPVDVIGDARSDRYTAALDAVLADPGVDEVLVILTPQSMTNIEDIARAVVSIRGHCHDKLLSASFMGASDVNVGVDILQAAGIPHYILPEWACRAMANVEQVRRWMSQGNGQDPPLRVDAAAAAALLAACPEGYMREDHALAALQAYGLPVPEFKLCATADEAVAFADRIGYPATLRVVSPEVIHKSEVKGIALNLEGPQAVREAFARIQGNVKAALPQAKIMGMLVRRMIPAGHEVILGAKRDAVFGPTLMFGLGGIFVEIFKDVTFALAPLSSGTASRMLREVRAFQILDGARGQAKADIAGIEQALRRLGQLVHDFPRIAELDVNPLIVGPAQQGNAVADVRIRLAGQDQ